MTKPQAFVVQPEWRGSQLRIGSQVVAAVYGPSETVRWLTDPNNPWSAFTTPAYATQHATEAEARAAVEAAVREALGGRPHDRT